MSVRIQKNYSLSKLASLRIGGPTKYYCTVKTEKELEEIIAWSNARKIKWIFVGGGYNLVPNDFGYDGMIIKNKIEKFKVKKNIYIGAGNDLLRTIMRLNSLGFSGTELMAGIPGTVGGAIYGCAGAYGQEIKDHLVRIRCFDCKDKKVLWLEKEKCHFNYRESIFKKKKNLIILGAEFSFSKESPKKLIAKSKEIIQIREKRFNKYQFCPGSFFKNIILNKIKPVSLKKQFISKIDSSKIIFGKIPTGYLIESIGLNGRAIGGMKVSAEHGNIIYNTGRGTSVEIIQLVDLIKKEIKNKFGVILEEEVQYI